MAVALSSIAMIFVSFTSAYVVRQGLPTLDTRSGTLVHDWVPVPLPPLLFVNTLVLLISSLTIALARQPPQVVPHDVGDEIPHPPVAVRGGKIPLRSLQLLEELDQRGALWPHQVTEVERLPEVVDSQHRTI